MAGETILIIDDEVNLRVTLAAILQRAGYTVTAVGHPTQALQSLTAGPFDLVFLDLQLPDMDGLTLLGELRRLYPEMPVLILTAHATLKSSIEAVRLGARDYLLKPLDPPQILSRVQEMLETQRHAQRRREIVAQIQALLAELQQLDQVDGEQTPPDLLLAGLQAAIPSSRFLQRGPLTVDLHARSVLWEGAAVTLPPGAFDYLVTLVRHAPEPVTYTALVMQSQGYEVSRHEAQELARWRIHQLRQALERDPGQPQYIHTVRGVGYRLVI